MDTQLRKATAEDARPGGRVMYEAFKTLADQHGFPPDFPSVEVAGEALSMLIAHPGFYGIVAEQDGRVVGSNFMDERSAVFGIGPISVDPAVQNAGLGRQLMTNVLDRAGARKALGIRLLQAAYHNRSLCLYSALGFRVREPLSVMRGPPLNLSLPGYRVRPAEAGDLDACDRICRDVHGFARSGEVMDAIHAGHASVVEHLGAISGYSTLIGFFGHSVARTDADLMALIGAATEFHGPGYIVPTRNHRLLTWCLANKQQLVMQMTLMSIGFYNEPAGAYLPSVLF